MGKQLAGKVQIYDETVTVDIEGSIVGAAAGDYVEINSKPKRSQIREGKYKLTAVELGEHTLYIKDKNGNVRGQATLTINKGTQGVSGSTITIDNASQTATLNITSISTNLGIEITKVSEEKAPFVNPYTEGTLAYEILNDNNDLPSAEDDYTTTTGNLSYYYRGAVENNYVNYSGMCWRIVRIEGDGSVKLILEDKSSNCNDATKYTGNWEVAESGYGFQQWWNQWGEAGSIIDYKDEFALRNNLINWLENSVINQNQLKTDEWCLGNLTDVYNYYNDHSLLTDENTTIKDLKYDGTIMYYFETGKRLDGIEGNPVMTFNCKSIGYEYDSLKVGTLTADEAMFAGASRNQNTSNLYLINNYQKNNNKGFWTLSPHSGDTTADKVYYLSSSKMNYDITPYTTDDWNEDIYVTMYGSSWSVRPAITLLKETPLSTNTTSTQVGTQTNPYVID